MPVLQELLIPSGTGVATTKVTRVAATRRTLENIFERTMRVWGILKNATTSKSRKVGCSTEEPRLSTIWRAVRFLLYPTLKHPKLFDKKRGVPPLRFQAPVITPLTGGEIPSLDAQNGD